MSRKDAMIIAVLMNVGLLAVLFATAAVDGEVSSTPAPTPAPVTKVTPPSQPSVAPPSRPRVFAPPVEEEPVPAPPAPPVVEEPPVPEIDPVPPPVVEEVPEEAPPPAEEKAPVPEPTTKEVVVQEGDALEKIARAHGTTVSKIKEASGLSHEKIRVGQKLRVPVESGRVASAPPVKTLPEPAPETIAEEYYTVQSGDNPWKIAKKCHVGYFDLLALNDLDEARARNLKAGDKIRIR